MMFGIDGEGDGHGAIYGDDIDFCGDNDKDLRNDDDCGNDDGDDDDIGACVEC